MNIINYLKAREVIDELIINNDYEKYFLDLLKCCKQQKSSQYTRYDVLNNPLFTHYHYYDINGFSFIEKSLCVLYSKKFGITFDYNAVRIIIQNFFINNNLDISIIDCIKII